MNLQKIKTLNDRGARSISNLYGNPVLIWLSIAFSIFGAFVNIETLTKMTYWSNSFQLTFCFVSVYINILNLQAHYDMKTKHAELVKSHDELKDKHDALHDSIKKIHSHLGIDKKNDLANADFMI